MQPTTPTLLALTSLACTLAHAEPPPGEFMAGATVCDFLAHQTWDGRAPNWHPLRELRQNGINWARIGVTTQTCPELQATDDWAKVPWRDATWSSREYALRIARIAQDEGLRLDVFLFLSHTAAHGGIQAAPPEWADLSLDAMCERIEQNCFDTASAFREQGLKVEVFEIGNEIERGVLGFGFMRVPPDKPVDWSRMLREDPKWLHENVWREEAVLLKAAIRGLRRAGSEAKIGLHISAWPPPNDAFVPAFFEAMVAEAVPYDYAGLSVYPAITPGWQDYPDCMDAWLPRFEAIHKPVILTETSYPMTETDGATPMPAFPFTPQGQADFMRATLDWCRGHQQVAGVFYFYADHVSGVIPNALSGLFQPGDPPKPAPALEVIRDHMRKP